MTSKVSKEKFEMPVILYEDTENGAFSFPYIEVLEGKEMPKVLFMFEASNKFLEMTSSEFFDGAKTNRT